MTVTPKYKAVPVFWDTKVNCVQSPDAVKKFRAKGKLDLPEHIFRFDSQHEFRVWLELCRMYGEDRVIRQFPLTIYEPGYCYPKGKNWKVDFAVWTKQAYTGHLHYVEAKGACLPEFASTLAAFETCNFLEFKRLNIIFTNTIPKENKVIAALLKTDYQRNLLTLKELRQLPHLPSHR